MPTDRLAPAEARAVAGELVRTLRERSRASLLLGGAGPRGVDLAAALEQRLFFALRDGDADDRRGWRALPRRVATFGQVLGALGLSLVPRRRPAVAAGGIVALIRQPARLAILAPIDAALRALGARPMAIVRVGSAAAAPERGEAAARTANLTAILLPGTMSHVPAFQLRAVAGLAAVEPTWGSIVGRERAASLRGLAERELALVALGAAGVQSVIRRWRPALLVAFDEVGTWSRILPAVARSSGIPTLNLPHAEAAVPTAIAGADYDRFAVFGPGAAAALAAAGIEAARIVETGAPHFDALATRPHPEASTGSVGADAARPRLVLLAAQYIQGAMTRAGLEACHRAAIAAAAAVAPAEVLVMPHPLQQQGLIEGIVAATPVPAGVAVRVEQEAGLHDRIDDAWLLVTGWSNSVFEAALRGVPALLVDPSGVSPVRYDDEGLGLGVTDEASAASAARSLLDPATRAQTLARASAALARHLGPSDGHAADRTARLMLAMSRGDRADEPARD